MMRPFNELLARGELAAAASLEDLDPADALRLARRIAEEIPLHTEHRVMPRHLDAAILAGAKAGHFVPGSRAAEVLAQALFRYAPPVRGKTPLAQKRIANLLVNAGLVDSVLGVTF